MNQEKLAKLQAQVRIGGKVSGKKICFFSHYTKCLIFCKTHNLLFEFCTTSLNAKNALTEERLHKILSHP